MIIIRENYNEEDETTRSILTFVPSAEDGGAYLRCLSENLRLANSTMEDRWKLDIYCE